MPLADQLPRDDDDVIRRVSALEKLYGSILSIAGNAKALAAAIQTGLANVASSGQTWQGPVNSGAGTIQTTGTVQAGTFNGGSAASGTVNAGNINTNGRLVAVAGIRSTGVNGNDLSSAGGGSKIVYSNNTSGDMGYLPSSRAFKQDIQAAKFDYDKLRAVTVYFFRYKAAVEAHPDDAYLWMGAMAEDLHAAGFTQLVDYEDEKPAGVQMQLMWVIPQMLSVAQADLIDTLTGRVAALERMVRL